MCMNVLKRQFDRDGFVVVRQFLSEHERAELVHQVDRYLRQVVPTLPASRAFYVDAGRPETLKQVQIVDEPYFEAYRRQPHWTQLAEMLIGEPVEARDPGWFNKPPGTSDPTPPHQDNFYWCRKPPNVLTMWYALDKVDHENGCLRYLPGSLRHGVRPHSPTEILGFSQEVLNYTEDEQQREVAVELDPGDLVVHHGNTIHRADPNRSPTRHRAGFAMSYMGVSCRCDEEATAYYMAAKNRQHAKLGLK